MVPTNVGMRWFSQGKLPILFSLSTAWIKIMRGEEKTRGFFFYFLLFGSGQGERGWHIHPNDPIGHIHPNDPIGHIHPNDPIGHIHPNFPIGHIHPNDPIGHIHPNDPIGHIHPNDPNGHIHPNDPIGHICR
jgi:hypothetical protein